MPPTTRSVAANGIREGGISVQLRYIEETQPRGRDLIHSDFTCTKGTSVALVPAARAPEAFEGALLKSCDVFETGIAGLHPQPAALSKMGPTRGLKGSSTLQAVTHHLSLTQSPVLVTHCVPRVSVTNLDPAGTVVLTVNQSDFQTSCEGKTIGWKMREMCVSVVNTCVCVCVIV